MKYYYRRDEDYAFLLVFALVATLLAAFVRHVWWIITICMLNQPIYGGQIVLAIIGIIFPPIGALHGIWLWVN
jgi:hypothetical protein